MALQPRQLETSLEAVSNHPLLREAASGTLSTARWIRYFSARLEAGGAFVKLLQGLEAQAAAEGYPELAAACRGNLNEELGIVDGDIDPLRPHETWRQWFRAEMAQILTDEGETITFRPADDFPEVQGYPAMFQRLVDEDDILQGMGALAMLEYGLAAEYRQILRGMRLRFRPLTKQGGLYLRSHGQHDARHGDEVWQPLARACQSEDDERRVEQGIALATETKLAFLSGAYRIAGDA